MKRILCSILLALAACSAPVDAKGGEDNPLAEDGKTDSWFMPTEQGEMRFSAPNNARLTEDTLYHSWTFTLTDDAEINLSTRGEMNLDTVMYLYHRTDSEESWGRYARKNDDDGDLVSSRIVHEAVAGEYRVVVKGYKTRLRGPFSLLAECMGAGCSDSMDTCEADTYEPLPSSTGWTESCSDEVLHLLSGDAMGESGSSIGLSEKCDLRGLERVAIDYYVGFWDEIVGFEEQFRFDGEEIYLEFQSTRYTDGVAIFVSAGGDEDGLEMYFNNDGRLLAAYQHNQSPTVDYYCGNPGEMPVATEPDEDCFNSLYQVLPRSEESPRESGNADVADATAIHPGLGAAMARFIADAGLDADEVVEYDLITWSSFYGEEGVAANFVGPDDISAEYTMYDGFGWEVLFITDANGVTMVCE